MKSWIAVAAMAGIMAVAGSADAKKKNKNVDPVIGIPDLAGESFRFKSKCDGVTCKLNNFSFVVRNIGTADMPNSRVEFWLSSDPVLNVVPDTINPVADVLIHTQSLGKVKAGKTKKRTVGGGHLKRVAALPGQYIIAVVDSGLQVPEIDEINNVFASAPLP